jgi:MoaA/NifB/PqqE/SkfB family radical SAM enzyme
MSEFKPYKPEEMYKVVLSKDEVMLIQKMRDMKYGSLVIHFVGGKPVRTETTNSEMTNEAKDSKVTIEFEVIEGAG